MTIITTQSRIGYAGDGVTTGFPIPFEFFLNSDITAVKTAVGGAQSILVLNVDYTLAGAGVIGGGSANKTTPLLTGEVLALFLNPPITQASHYISNSPFPSATLENDIDRQAQISQRLQDQISRSIRAPDGDAGPGMLLPPAAQRALMYQAYDASGNAVVVPSLPGSAITQASLGVVLYPQTAAESAASVVPTFYFYPPGDVRRYGADMTGAADSTVPFQNAVKPNQSVTAPTGRILISGQINFTNTGQKITGAGHAATFINVAGPNAAFIAGIFNVTSGESGPEFADFCLSCAQPATPANFAALNVYPPMIFVNATPRLRIRDVRLTGGIDGIYQSGNCGGFIATRVESGCFGKNHRVDGNVDITQWIDCQVWVFSATGIMTTQQQALMAGANCYGLYSLRSDYSIWTGGLFLCATSAYFGTSGSGTTYGSFSQTAFDTFGGLTVTAGQIQAIDCIFSVGGILNGATIPTNNAATHTGGILNISGGNVFLGNSSTLGNNAVFFSNGAGGAFALHNVDISLGNLDLSAVVVAATGTAEIRITSNGLNRIGSGAYTTPILDIRSGWGVIANNVMFANVNATGNTNWLSMPNAVNYKVGLNTNYNWSTSIAGSTVASVGFITIPPVFGDAMPIVQVTGTTNIFGMAYALVGVTAPYAGQEVTLQFAGALTVSSGTVGSAGAFVLNGRANYTVAANSTLKVQLMPNGNWQETGRCA